MSLPKRKQIAILCLFLHVTAGLITTVLQSGIISIRHKYNLIEDHSYLILTLSLVIYSAMIANDLVLLIIKTGFFDVTWMSVVILNFILHSVVFFSRFQILFFIWPVHLLSEDVSSRPGSRLHVLLGHLTPASEVTGSETNLTILELADNGMVFLRPLRPELDGQNVEASSREDSPSSCR
jgi:hypothetical protein